MAAPASLNPHLAPKLGGWGFGSMETLRSSEDGIAVGAVHACLQTYVSVSHLYDQTDWKRATSENTLVQLLCPVPLEKVLGQANKAATRQ